MVEGADLTTPVAAGPGPGGASPLGEGLVTAEHVAAHLAVDVSTVYRLASSGALPVVVIGRAKRFRVADVRTFVEGQTHRRPSAVSRSERLLGTRR